MDATDYAIYRYLAPEGLSRFWASRRVLDPRVTARALAARVGLSEAGVRARLKGLKERGLLRGSTVHLNPSLFGASVAVLDVPVRDPRDSEGLFRDLAVLEGALFARDVMDETERKVSVYLAAESPSALTRRSALLRRLAPGEALRPPRPYWVPRCERSPSALDWRLLSAVRAEPDGTLADLAERARLSLKTAARRLGALVDDHAFWWSHSSATDEWPLALLDLGTPDASASQSIAAFAGRPGHVWLPVAPDGLGSDPGSGEPRLAGLVPAETPAGLERTVRQLLDLPGVERVRRTFGLGSATFAQWADERLGAVLAGSR